MINTLRPALALILSMTALTGLAYPLAVTGIAQVLLPAQANGSLVEKNGIVVGSRLIGQSFTSDRYFWPRPSATAPDPYNGAGSSGSNLGTTSVRLRDRVAADIKHLADTGFDGAPPAEAVTASGSGLDPHISPRFATGQIARVARARGIAEGPIAALVQSLTRERDFGVVGEPRVNVLELNLALDDLKT